MNDGRCTMYDWWYSILQYYKPVNSRFAREDQRGELKHDKRRTLQTA